MNIIFELSQINLDNIIFSDSKKNAIMDGSFTKIIYSDECLSTNGLYINFPLQIQLVETNANKHVFKFNIHQPANSDIIQAISLIEQQILQFYKQFYKCDKPNTLILADHLNYGNIKINIIDSSNNEHSNVFQNVSQKSLFIKISGIWETGESVGITYKFIEIKSKQ